MNDIKCPYCNEELEIDHDDGYGYSEDEVFEQECGKCGMNFIYTTSILFSYCPEKAPCLNGEPHSWKDIVGVPPGYQKNKHHCSCCDKVEEKDDSLKYDGKTDSWIKKEPPNDRTE